MVNCILKTIIASSKNEDKDFFIDFMSFLQINVDCNEYYFDMEPYEDGYLIWTDNYFCIQYMVSYIKENSNENLKTNSKSIAKASKITLDKSLTTYEKEEV